MDQVHPFTVAPVKDRALALFLAQGTLQARQVGLLPCGAGPDLAPVEVHHPGQTPGVEQQVVAIEIGMKDLSVVELPDCPPQRMPFTRFQGALRQALRDVLAVRDQFDQDVGPVKPAATNCS